MSDVSLTLSRRELAVLRELVSARLHQHLGQAEHYTRSGNLAACVAERERAERVVPLLTRIRVLLGEQA